MKERKDLKKLIFENRRIPKIALPIVAFIAIWLLAVFCGFWVETNDDIGFADMLQIRDVTVIWRCFFLIPYA